MVLHLDSRFFDERTLKSLVYAAPFAAPLAYTGLGLLLIMNRMVDADSEEWPYWVLLMALGGFVGNFIFSLTDHAQNGFFHSTEWIPVVSSAFAVGFLVAPFVTPVGRRFLWLCAVVLLVQAAVGLLGFYYHTAANLRGPSPRWFDNFVHGPGPGAAPVPQPGSAGRHRPVCPGDAPAGRRDPGAGTPGRVAATRCSSNLSFPGPNVRRRQCFPPVQPFSFLCLTTRTEPVNTGKRFA